jgi:lysophosphatidate acyltransferase
MFHLWPTMKKCTVVAKHELLYTGPFGLASWLSGLIFINRIRSDKARDVINEAVSKLKVQKIKLWVFPEGTRRNTGEIHPFKKGTFHVAIAGQIPILPVVFSSYKSFLDDANKNMVAGDIILSTLEPISTEGLTADDIPELMERTRRVMLETFKATTKEIEMRVANRRNQPVIDAASGKNLEKKDINETILPNQRIPKVN